MTRRLRDLYGAGPFHLLGVLLCFAVAAYALSRALESTAHPDRILLWLGGSIVAHDLVLLPVYALIGFAAGWLLLGRGESSRVRIAALNHLRFPALVSGLLLLVWFPLVAGPAERGFERITGLSKEVYFERWLIVTAALFAGSAIVFALRRRRLARDRPVSTRTAGRR
jgi:hypothetical protein